MSSRHSILIISFSAASRDPRIYRQALYLKDYYDVTVAAFDSVGLSGVRNIIIPPASLPKLTPVQRRMRQLLLLARQYDLFNKSEPLNFAFHHALQSGQKYDLIIANEVNSVPLALGFAEQWNVPLVADTHEYAPGQADNEWLWRLGHQGYQEHMCRKYLTRANHVFSVCQGIADLYEKNFNVRSELLLNCPDPEPDLKPRAIDPERIRLIHHGSASRRRQIEQMIYLMDQLDKRFTLDLILMDTDKAYYDFLVELINARPNITLRPAVAMKDIARDLNEYDMGLLMFAPTTTNLKHVLPNKLFEFIQARLAVATWPSPEIVAISKKYNLGPCSSSFSVHEMAEAINSLSEKDITSFKNSSVAAAQIYHSGATAVVLQNAICNLLTPGLAP